MIPEAAFPGYAENAGPDLDRFQDGLRATHDGQPSQNTVRGHSYGSTVVGIAARDHDLTVDNIVLVGSPGAGVDHASELNHPPDQVFATTARNDIIGQAARRPGGRPARPASPRTPPPRRPNPLTRHPIR